MKYILIITIFLVSFEVNAQSSVTAGNSYVPLHKKSYIKPVAKKVKSDSILAPTKKVSIVEKEEPRVNVWERAAGYLTKDGRRIYPGIIDGKLTMTMINKKNIISATKDIPQKRDWIWYKKNKYRAGYNPSEIVEDGDGRLLELSGSYDRNLF